MDLFKLTNDLAILFPVDKLRRDFLEYVQEEFDVTDDVITFDINGKIFFVPLDFSIDVVARVVQSNSFPHYLEGRIVIAIGGIVSEKCGVVTPKYFLVKLFYNEKIELFNADLDYF